MAVLGFGGPDFGDDHDFENSTGWPAKEVCGRSIDEMAKGVRVRDLEPDEVRNLGDVVAEKVRRHVETTFSDTDLCSEEEAEIARSWFLINARPAQISRAFFPANIRISIAEKQVRTGFGSFLDRFQRRTGWDFEELTGGNLSDFTGKGFMSCEPEELDAIARMAELRIQLANERNLSGVRESLKQIV